VAAWAQSGHTDAFAALKELGRMIEEQKRTWERDFLLSEIRAGALALYHATSLVRSAGERQKPDAERDAAYQERELAQWRNRLDREQANYDIPADKALLAAWLRRVGGLPRARDLDALYTGTRVTDRTERLKMSRETTEQLRARKDPFLDLAFTLEPELQALKQRDDRRAGAIARLRPVWRKAVIAHAGKPVAPDANSTLRVSFAHVKGYSPRDGVLYEPFTTLAGVIEKHTGEEPFNVPVRVREAAINADPSLPVNFLADADTTGGNSGSPVVNGRGELVGLNYNPAIARNVSVDVRYLLWILRDVENAKELLGELLP
jgi:hypothetical protein